jgi:hypothetical protein
MAGCHLLDQFTGRTVRCGTNCMFSRRTSADRFDGAQRRSCRDDRPCVSVQRSSTSPTCTGFVTRGPFAAVERALAHHQVARGQRNKRDTVRARIATLTPREREVFELIIRGRPTSRSAARWGRSSARSRLIGTRRWGRCKSSLWRNYFSLPGGPVSWDLSGTRQMSEVPSTRIAFHCSRGQ